MVGKAGGGLPCRYLDAFEGLASGLKIGCSADIREGYFKYLVGFHVIYYRQQDMEIAIIRILHQRMDVSLHL
ncbi:MAG: type II toxin-antitoxin system RelE/ParE family toxin [Rhizobium sp.]